MRRALCAFGLCGALSLCVLGGCSSARVPEVSRAHLPVIGLSTASVYVEYGGSWTDHRWQSGLSERVWKLVRPVSRSDETVASAEHDAFRTGYKTSDRGYAGRHNSGAIVGATSSRVPRSGYALVERTSTMSFANTSEGRAHGGAVTGVQVGYAARHRQGTRTYGQYTESEVWSAGHRDRSVRPMLEVSVTLEPEYVIPGDLAEMVVLVTNPSSEEATDAVVHVQLPAGARLRGVEGARDVDELVEEAVLELGDMEGGSERRLVVKVEVGDVLKVAMAR